MTAPTTPILIGAPDSNTVLTHTVRALLPDLDLEQEVLDQVVSTVAGVLAGAAWQLQEFVDHAEQQPELDGLTKLYIPFHPNWSDIAVWLQRARDKSEITAEQMPEERQGD